MGFVVDLHTTVFISHHQISNRLHEFHNHQVASRVWAANQMCLWASITCSGQKVDRPCFKVDSPLSLFGTAIQSRESLLQPCIIFYISMVLEEARHPCIEFHLLLSTSALTSRNYYPSLLSKNTHVTADSLVARV